MSGFEIFLCVLAGIIMLIVLILSIPVHVYFSYNDKVHLSIRYLFLKFEILPLGEKKGKKAKKEKKPKEEKPKEEKEEEKPKEKKPNKILQMVKANGFDGMMEVFSNLGSVLLKYGKNLLKAFKFNDIYVYSLVGTGDAASTAIQYGETCQKVYFPIGFICNHALVRHYEIDISADFLANSSEGKTSFDFMINVRRLINSTIGLAVRVVAKVALKFLKNGIAKSGDKDKEDKKKIPVKAESV